MQDSGANRPLPPTDATGSWKPSEVPAPGSRDDPPTIRTGGTPPESHPSHVRPAVLPLPQPGDRLESFELERAIGAGGMGAVYLAVDTRLHREVALKILPPEQSGDSEVVQRFYQEGRAAARLDHENIARVFTIGTDKGFHFIAFEYIEGVTLRQKVQEHGTLRVDEAINYTLQIAGALVHAAERGVVHRDIKPSNIIVTPQGRAKLVDMGLARKFERGEDDGLTQSGMTLGTFDYISPEQARDPRDVDVRGDLYSLGCTLFHMLTGRPPFPDGTVLQKLLQHQEEPPPDVRALNPSVPPDLAAILTKLMAKDRDRRYQTPELLVRDLLTVAGALGLRSLSPEGLVWMSPQQPPAWEKHLVWGVPALALGLVVGGLFWWGQAAEPNPLAADGVLASSGLANPPVSSAPLVPNKAREDMRVPPQPTVTPEAKAKPQAARLAREVSVKTSEELATALATEASGSTVILGSDGPFLMRSGNPATKDRRDLTLKAAPEFHPVIRPSRSLVKPDDPGSLSLLAFGEGTVTIEGVEFQADARGEETAWSAISCEGTTLILRKCSLRAPSGRRSGVRLSAIRLMPSAARPDGFATSSLEALDCHVDGGQVGVWVQGPADLRLRDCTFGAGEPTVWLDNASAAGVVPVQISLKNVSIRASREPAIQMAKTAATIIVDHSVIATAKDRDGVLVVTDDPNRLVWRGRGNLFAGIATFLQSTGSLAAREPIRKFSLWADDPLAFREVDSAESETPVWRTMEPGVALNRVKISESFGLLPRLVQERELGARRGPSGLIDAVNGLEVALEAENRQPAKAVVSGVTPFAQAETKSASPTTSAREPKTAEPTSIVSAVVKPLVPPATDNPLPMPMAPMDRDAEIAAIAEPKKEPEKAAPSPDTKPPIERPRIADATLVRTSQSLIAEFARLAERGGTIRLAGDLDLRLGSIVIRGPGRIVLEPEVGEARPKLRFRPERAGAKQTLDHPSLFQIQGGSLELRRIDVILEQVEAPSNGDWSAFALQAGADLTLNRCTVTVEGRSPRSSVARVVLEDDPVDFGLVGFEPATVQFRATDTLFRSGGDLIDVAAGRRLDLELSNCVVGTIGSLAHAHGLPRGSTPETIKMILRQVTARAQGGIAFLETAAGEPELPLADVVARDSIVTTGDRSRPLFRLDGQDAIDALQDRLRWEGNGVVYHEIDTYRLHQTSQTGTLPQPYDRQSWEVSVGSREMMPIHGDAGFVNDWPENRPASSITREDVQLGPNASAPSSGPDWRRIPVAPSSR